MTLSWDVSGPLYQGRYTRRADDMPALEWGTGTLSRTYDLLVQVFEEEQQRARAEVMARSRVDTGFMRSNVESFMSATGTVLNLEFGWDYGRPLYAIFQEFGTRNGITPMKAVHETFYEVLRRLETAVSRW